MEESINIENEISTYEYEEEPVETPDNSFYLEEILTQLETMETRLEVVESHAQTQTQTQAYILGIGIFAVVVVLCVFSYKFFRIFF